MGYCIVNKETNETMSTVNSYDAARRVASMLDPEGWYEDCFLSINRYFIVSKVRRMGEPVR